MKQDFRPLIYQPDCQLIKLIYCEAVTFPTLLNLVHILLNKVYEQPSTLGRLFYGREAPHQCGPFFSFGIIPVI